jgi:hypothetical protein
MVGRRSRGMPVRYCVNSGVAGPVARNGPSSRSSVASYRNGKCHFRGEIYLDAQLAGRFREHQARQVVRLRILLPVDEVLRGRDLERVGEDARAAMRRRPQPHDLRAEHHRPVVPVVHDVIERYVNRHRFGSQARTVVYSMRAARAGERSRAACAGKRTGVGLMPPKRPGRWPRGGP